MSTAELCQRIAHMGGTIFLLGSLVAPRFSLYQIATDCIGLGLILIAVGGTLLNDEVPHPRLRRLTQTHRRWVQAGSWISAIVGVYALMIGIVLLILALCGVAI